MRLLVGTLLFLLAWGLSALFLHDNRQDKERQHLAENNVVAATTYQASVATYQLATEILFAEIMQHDQVLDTFAAGVKAVGPERDLWRGQLYRLLAPSYAQLRQRGIRQLHFHTADGYSFLRFHAPHLCDDPLFDARPSVRLANKEHRPVTGFEAGKVSSGFRYVFPVFRGDEHIGSVETSINFRSIRETMTSIDPTREYAIVLRRDLVEEIIFNEQRPLYETAPLHDDFLVEDPHLQLPDSAPPTSEIVHRLDKLLHKIPQVQLDMTNGEAFTVPVSTAAGDWAVSFVPVRDILGRQAAYVVAYARNPFSATLRRDFYLSLGIMTLFLGAFAWFTWGLLRSRGRLRREKRHLQTITDTIGDGLYVTTSQGVIERVNPMFSRLLGYRGREVVGRVGHELFYVRADGTPFRNPADCPICAAMRQGKGYVGEELFRRKDGTLLNVEISCQPIRSGAETTGMVAAFRDITKRKESDERIRYLAEYDTLTNLPNRTLFLDRLRQTIIASHRERELFAVLFLDIDLFKSINDSLGHPVGDQLLQETARRLVDCVRTSDTVSRQGGDEFIIILRQIREAAAPAQIARKMLAAMSEPFFIDKQELRVSGSIGIALYPADGEDEAALIKNADAAMYHAKKLGRNNYQFFTADLNVRARQRLEMENNLRLALDRREFLLHYQPQVELESGRIIGVEALLRWQHPEQGLVPPGEFIPLAEECGLIVPIGEWVLREACRQNKAWQDEGAAKLPVAVNLSPIQFRRDNLEEVIRQALTENGLAPEYLEIEITESLLMSAENQTIAQLYQLKNLGLSVAIDDFGTGYSSLSYLKLFPIDKLKVDRSFVRDVSSDPDDAAIISAIIAMAHRLRLQVLAEGVETVDQRNFLILEGCNEAQGFHYSRPLPAEQMKTLLQKGLPLPPMPESLDPV